MHTFGISDRNDTHVFDFCKLGDVITPAGWMDGWMCMYVCIYIYIYIYICVCVRMCVCVGGEGVGGVT